MQAFGIFGLCQIHAFVDYLRSRLNRDQFNLLFRSIVILFLAVTLGAAGIATALGECDHHFRFNLVTWQNHFRF